MKTAKTLTLLFLLALSGAFGQTRINGSRVIEGTLNYCSDVGSSGAYACNPGISAYVANAQYCFRANTANSGAASLNLNSLGAIFIKKWRAGSLVDLETGDVAADQRVCVIYDGSAMQLLSRTANAMTRSFGGTFDGAGSALTGGVGTAIYTTVPFGCAIASYDILVNAGTATFKLWRKPAGTAIPTNGDSISTSGVSISSGTALHSTTLTDFTSTTITANDVIGVNLSAVATATWAHFQVNCQ